MSRLVSVSVLVAVLALAACGGGDDASDDAASTPTATAGATQATGADLPDGVAAEVGDATIDAARVEERGQIALDNPELSGQLPEDPERAREVVEASVLGQMIVTAAVLQGAESEGIEVTDEDLGAKRQEIEEQVGGADVMQQQIEDLGYDDEELEQQLRSLVVLDRIEEQEAPDDGSTAAPTAPGQPAPGQVAVQQWLTEQVAAIEITVDRDFGTWNAEALQVIPPGGMPQPAAPPTGAPPTGAPPTAPPPTAPPETPSPTSPPPTS